MNKKNIITDLAKFYAKIVCDIPVTYQEWSEIKSVIIENCGYTVASASIRSALLLIALSMVRQNPDDEDYVNISDEMLNMIDHILDIADDRLFNKVYTEEMKRYSELAEKLEE